jgi:UDP-N-acetylglucosamine diphosphorylase/glucosamine-1-phosphate N-acetyltransferase
LQTPLPNIPAISVNAKMIRYPWDLIGYLKKELTADLLWMKKEWAVQKDRRMIHPGAYLIDEDNIFIGEGSTLKPGCVLDAEEGPIVIGRGVTVMPQSTIIGPVYIADGSVVKVGAKIYEGTSIGPVCKIGGEIEGSIIHGYSNKQHDGFLGHSYLCAWVNLGAGTTNSDLKNNYGPVRIQLGNQFIDTGLQFVGSFIGDHSKTAINSTLNTGTVIGVCSNIFGSGFPPKCVPSFSWGAAGETLTTYTIEHALDVAKRVMERRKVQLLDSEQQLFRDIFALTQPERMLRGMPA